MRKPRVRVTVGKYRSPGRQLPCRCMESRTLRVSCLSSLFLVPVKSFASYRTRLAHYLPYVSNLLRFPLIPLEIESTMNRKIVSCFSNCTYVLEIICHQIYIYSSRLQEFLVFLSHKLVGHHRYHVAPSTRNGTHKQSLPVWAASRGNRCTIGASNTAEAS